MEMNTTDFTHHVQYFRIRTNSLLFIPAWSTSGVYGLTAAMLTAIILSVTYECLAEYLLYLKNTAIARKTRPECCGSPTISCWEKLVQTIVHLLRVLLGYLLMLCVMTMNIWLLAAVLVGAVVGYGVGKPLVANCIMDLVSSHGYRLTSVQMSYGKNNKSQRSTSWRYTKDMLDTDSVKLREEIEHLTGGADLSHHDDVFGESENNTGTEIIWIRRSDLELEKSTVDDIVRNDVQMRKNERKDKVVPKDLNETADSIKSDDSLLSRTSSRFKSTSKVINASFRTTNSDSYRQSLSRQSGFDSIERARARQSVSRTSSMNTPSVVPVRGAVVNRSASSASYKHGPTKMSPQTASRYKSISRQISKDLTTNTVTDRV